VSITGCSKGYVFTAGPRSVEHPGSVDVPEGMHLRMNGPKSVIADIKAHEGSAIEITGIMKKGQYGPDGVAVGGGVRVGTRPGTQRRPRHQRSAATELHRRGELAPDRR
jgi:hypothetical protein